MKVSLKQLMDYLGIDRILMSYESDIHQYYDALSEKTCSAEARMGPDQDDLELDIQIFYDTPPEGKSQFEQVLIMKIRPKIENLVGKKLANDHVTKMKLQSPVWEAVSLKVKGDDIAGKFSEWEKGAYAFYTAITHHLKMGEMPDIDALIDEHLAGESGRAGRAGRRGGGRKNPKFKPPTTTPGMKSGM